MHNSDVIAEIVFWHNIPQGIPPSPNNVNWSQFSYSYGSPQPKGKSINKVFVFEKGKAYTMWKSVGTSELLGHS